jgi:hypothetical protein
VQVGTRYTLLKVLGCGSFSSVVAALDNDTGEKVRQQQQVQLWLLLCLVVAAAAAAAGVIG